jgi:predicted MFS family arabinose efflux permease
MLWRWHDPALPARFTAALAAANSVWAYFGLPESLKPDRGAGGIQPLGRIRRMALAVQTPGLAPLLGLLFMIRFAFSALEWTFPIFLKRQFGFSFLHIGLLLAYTGVLMAVTQGLLVGRLAPALGERAMVALGTLVMALGFALVPFAPDLRGLLALAALLAVGAGLSNPSLTSLISQTGGADTQGGVFGVGQSLASLAMILGPAWGGFSFDRLGIWVPYTSSGVLMAAACAASLLAIRRPLRAADRKVD